MLEQDVFESIDRETGRLTYRQDIRDAGIDDPVDACPGLFGGHNWQASAYSPEAKSARLPAAPGVHDDHRPSTSS